MKLKSLYNKQYIKNSNSLNLNTNMMLDSRKGGQYVAVLTMLRKLSDGLEHKVFLDPKLQPYLDQHENALKRIHANALKHRCSGLIKYVGNKDEE